MRAILPGTDGFSGLSGDFSGLSGGFSAVSGNFSGLSAKTASQAEMLANRLRKRRRHLDKWARRTGAGVYRLYDRDIPEIPLNLDWYSCVEGGGVAGALYKRPYEKDQKEEAAWLEAMKKAAAGALAISIEEIYLRERKKQSHSESGGQYGRFTEKAIWREIAEYGLRYRVNLSGYLDTGIFPDRRLFRALLRREAAGRRLLNLFCYTGSLSVAAAAGGAASVDSVDLSNTYLDWAKDNFSLNGMKAVLQSPEDFFQAAKPGPQGRGEPQPGRGPQPGGGTEACGGTQTGGGTEAGGGTQTGGGTEAGPFSLIRADVLRFVKEARRRPLRWDTIILDPPAFSNSKKMDGTFDLKRDHGALAADCLSLLSPGGVLYLSANVKGFTLDTEGLNARRQNAAGIDNITEQLRDEDFKGRRIPETWRIRV